MSAEADDKILMGKTSGGGVGEGKSIISRSKLPPPPMKPPSPVKVQEGEMILPTEEEVSPPNKGVKPQLPKKPPVPPDKPASPHLSPADKSTKHNAARPKKNLEKPSPPPFKPKFSDLKKPSVEGKSVISKDTVWSKSIDDSDGDIQMTQTHSCEKSNVDAGRDQDISNGDINRDKSRLQQSLSFGNAEKARQSFNLKAALLRAADNKVSADKRLTPPRKFVPTRLSSHSLSADSPTSNKSQKSSDESSDEARSNDKQKTPKYSSSPSFSDRVKFWVKPSNKTPPSPNTTSEDCASSDIKAKKPKKTSSKGSRQRKPSAKFYVDDGSDRPIQGSVSSDQSSTFYVSDPTQVGTSGHNQKEVMLGHIPKDDIAQENSVEPVLDSNHKDNAEKDAAVDRTQNQHIVIGGNNKNSADQQDRESPPKTVVKKPKPQPPPKKPNLQPKISGISDNVFSDSPPLPKKTASNITKSIRDSMILRPPKDTPVAPLRTKKKSRRPGPLQLTMDSSRESSVEREATPGKRINSTSFTTDDFDVFQRQKSKDFDNLEREPMETSNSKDENNPSSSPTTVANQEKSKSVRRLGSGRNRDRDKRRSKSLGAPGFNIFGVKLKKVMPPTAEKPEDGGTGEASAANKWLPEHLSPEKLHLNVEMASGVYDNNFPFNHPAGNHVTKVTASKDTPPLSPVDNMYESMDQGNSQLKTSTDTSERTHKYPTPDSYDQTTKHNSHVPEFKVRTTSTEHLEDKSSSPVSGQVVAPTQKGVPPSSLNLSADSPRVVDHEYTDIGSPISSLAKCKSIENIYEDISDEEEDTGQVSGRNPPPPPPALFVKKPKSPLHMGRRLLAEVEGEEYSSHSSNVLQSRLERKLSRKLSRKVSRKLSRKLTKKFRENKYPKLQELLNAGPDSDEDNDGEWEDLSFSETDSEFDDDSFTDDSDMEFEQELLNKLAEDGNSELAEIYNTIHPMSKVQRIATELLTTERSFVEKLELLDQKFHFTIVLENRTQKMFPEEVIPQMFSNVKSIYQFHHDFLLPQLEKRMEDWETTPKIGDVMKKFAPFLKLYTEYVQNFDNANALISSWLEKSPKFASLLDKLQRLPESGHLSLQHHMLGPIQRVPRYEMLLKDYLKNLVEDSDDIEDTEKALELVTKAAQHSNETMRQNAKFRKLLDLNQALGSTVNLVSPTRELVKEGKIIKIAARNGLSQERYVFLFNDKLLVCQSVPVTLGIKQQYKVKLLMDIDGMQVLEGDNLEIPNTFYVKSKQRILEFHTETSEEKLEWQMTLWNVITDFTKKMQSRGEIKDLRDTFMENDQDLGKRAPKWVKDQETSQCMLCATAFTLIRRRHHCRACGKVVCGRCSDFYAKLAYDNNKSRRVCGDCFSKLDTSPGISISSPSLSQPVQRRKGVLNVKASDPCVISGYLQMTQDKKTWQKRFFSIHHDFVLFSFKAHQDVRALTSMPLPGYVLEEVQEEDGIEKTHVFKVSHKSPTGKKIYFFQADDRDTKQKWVDSLQHIVIAELPPGVLGTERSTSVLSDISQKQDLVTP